MNKQLDQQLSKLRIDKTSTRVRRRGNRWLWVVGAVIVVAALYAGYAKVLTPIKVKTVQVSRDSTATDKGAAVLTASGYVIPRRKVEISAKIIGVVKQTLVNVGDHVKKGDILLRIDDAEFQARVASAEARVAALRARAAEMRSGSRPQEIEAAEARVAAGAATLHNAELVLQRVQKLQKSGGVSKDELDRAIANRDTAKAHLESERKSAELVRIGPRKEQIEAAEAQLREAQADLALARTELGYTVIRAPIDGVILEKLAEEGELVTDTNFGGTRGAKNSVVSMADLTDLQIEVDVSETEVAKVKPHQRTEIRLDSNPGRVYSGEVDEISPQADPQKGTVQVKVRVIDPDNPMKTGMSANVTFLGESSNPKAGNNKSVSYWIPNSAVVQGKSPATVFTVVNGKARAKHVSLGLKGEKGVQVTAGLTGGNVVIVSPPNHLSDGAPVVASP